jgi:hypothetical protein
MIARSAPTPAVPLNSPAVRFFLPARYNAVVMERKFVVLRHSGYGPLHYDLMIEAGAALATWQLGQESVCEPSNRAWPAVDRPRAALAARRLGDHRLAYMEYEGPVSKGRGEVKRVDQGSCQVLSAGDDRWEVVFGGRTLRGRFELRRVGAADDWTIAALGD